MGGEGWMWVVGACLCFYSVQVFAHVHCVCVVCVLCVLCVYYVCCVFVCVCVFCICVCVCARVCVRVLIGADQSRLEWNQSSVSSTNLAV